MRLSIILFILALFLGCKSNIPAATVKITNLAGTSGGSGSILYSSPTVSQVLTNAHVCEVVKGGGLVHTQSSSHYVTSYKVSSRHDLCLITVTSSLGHTSSTIASVPPSLFQPAKVSGHPRLLPNILTEGHFSGKQVIQTLVGFRECSTEDLSDPDTQVFCIFIGQVPVIKTSEAILVSALIQPGSSGSAVYNDAEQIGAVIFAGSGEIGFGYAVPYEYVFNFIYAEVSTLKSKFPDNVVRISSSKQNSRNDLIIKVRKLCEKQQENKLCNRITSSLKYSDMIQN